MKILVRATNWVGDAVMSIPALEAIRGRWPQAEIVLLGQPWVAELYRGQPLADRVISTDETSIRGLRRERFDCAVLLPNSFAAAWFVWRAGIRERFGYARDARSALLTKAVPVPRPGEIPAHEAYYYLELLRRIGWIQGLPEVKEICLRVEPSALESGEKDLRSAGTRSNSQRVALAPGAAYGSAKCWAPERYAEVANWLIAEVDADVILFGTASESEVAEKIVTRMRHPPVNLVGQTQIGELPALFSRCHLFIGNDSGAMHVAAATGLPVVAIFGSTDANGTAPVTLRYTLVHRPVSCSPCFLRECPVDHRCMTLIEVAEVCAAARAWLERAPRGQL